MSRNLILAAVVAALVASPGRAEVPPAKPYADVVAEVVAFLVSDVGWNGIRTNDGDPEGYPVPPYFYSYSINDGNNLDGSLSGYPGYLSVSYPGYTASVAIDAFLDWRRWSGDPEGLARARQYADWILEHRTPAGDLYGNLPYSTQTDGVMGGGWDGPAIMTDKPAMFGLRLLRLHDITGEAAYLDGALEIAGVLAATQWTGAVADDGRWPFRVVPADGTVTQDYTSHLTPAVRFFDDLHGRTGDPAHAAARDRAWAWLLANPCDPASPSYMRWEGFYEDQTPAMQTGKGDHYSAHEMVAELLLRRPAGWEDLAATVFDSMTTRYVVHPYPLYGPYTPATLEWAGWPEGTYASTLQYARTALLLDRALAGHPRHDATWRPTALAMAAVCSHGQNDRGNAADGRMFTTIRDMHTYFNIDSWYEQNFNTVKYYLEIMDLEPSLAPAGECHILAADAALAAVEYPAAGPLVTYATAPGSGRERIRVPSRPHRVTAGGIDLPELGDVPGQEEGWHHDAATGVLTVQHQTGPVVVERGASSVPQNRETSGGLIVRAAAPAGSGRVGVDVILGRGGPLTVDVFDLRGRRVRRLAALTDAVAGPHRFAWDGRDAAGRTAAAGVYFVRGRSGADEDRGRVVLVR